MAGTGGIGYYHISDTYIALFSRFIPVGVWEAVYLIQGLLDQQSKARPTKVHTDTQGQALPVYALAHLFGFDLMPRVRNWKDLNFYRPSSGRATGTSTPCSASRAATSSTGTSSRPTTRT